MSEEPIHAEIVRADQIKVGDRIVWCDESVDVKTIEKGEYYGNGERIQFNALGVNNLLVKPSARVARILPEPVEVREYWRCSYEWERATPSCRIEWAESTHLFQSKIDAEERLDMAWKSHANGRDIRKQRIEHVRETVLSREEVRND